MGRKIGNPYRSLAPAERVAEGIERRRSESPRKRRIYLASSWRNPLQPDLVRILRRDGHEVYDFRNPPERTGFSWKQVDPDAGRRPVTFEHYLQMVHHPVATDGFRSDADAMEWADTIVLALPCGRSAHLELGWGCGQGKRTAVLFPPEPRTWDEIRVGMFVPGSGRITAKKAHANGSGWHVTFDREGDPFEEAWTTFHLGRRRAPVALHRESGQLLTQLEALEPELMYRFCDYLTNDEAELRAWLDG